jgi:hypothetical protein
MQYFHGENVRQSDNSDLTEGEGSPMSSTEFTCRSNTSQSHTEEEQEQLPLTTTTTSGIAVPTSWRHPYSISNSNCSHYHHHHQQQQQHNHHNFSGFVKRKTQFCTYFLILFTYLIVILESNLVIGALIHSNSNNNDLITNYTRYDDFSDLVDNDDTIYLNPYKNSSLNNINYSDKIFTTKRSKPIYQNEFAVYIPGGIDKAHEIANRYGFTNMGQVCVFPIFVSLDYSLD